MHYYQFNIADYRKDTQHLSPMEHYIYRSLLDWHYLDEEPIPLDTAKILRFLRLSNDSLTDVEQVLNDFWTETEQGYVQERVLAEISEYQAKIESASKAGKASAAARKAKKDAASEQTSNDRSTMVQPTNNHKPLTNNHTKPPCPASPPDVDKKFTDRDLETAHQMYHSVSQVAPKTKQPNFDKWADTIRLMREQDNLDHDEIWWVFKWANTDEFWRVNILSPGKLREKFSELDAKMRRGSHAGTGQRSDQNPDRSAVGRVKQRAREAGVDL